MKNDNQIRDESQDRITVIAALAVPVLGYRFGIFNWRLEEIRNIDRKTIKKLTMYKTINRLYVKKERRMKRCVIK